MLLIWIGIGLILAVIVTFGVMAAQSSSKKDAAKMIEAGTITDWKNYKRTMDVLKLMTDDLEAIDLYQQLKYMASSDYIPPPPKPPNWTSPSARM